MDTKQRRTLNRNFGLIMTAGFAVLAVIRFVLVGELTWWLLGPALAFLLGTVLAPAILDPLRSAWMALAGVLGYVNQRILLTIVFAAMITPLAVILRVLGKTPMRLSWKEKAATYWHPRRCEEFAPERMERQF